MWVVCVVVRSRPGCIGIGHIQNNKWAKCNRSSDAVFGTERRDSIARSRVIVELSDDQLKSHMEAHNEWHAS